MKIKLLAISAAALLGSTTANATVVLFSNFDSIALARGRFVIVPTADGWTGGPLGIEIQNNAAGVPFSSPNLVELDTTRNSSMFYTLGAGRYTVSYYYSPRPNQNAVTNGITLSVGSTLLDSVATSGTGTTAWQLRTVNFSTGGGPLTFAATGTSNGVGGYLDNITITAVPEAATWAMLIAGFGMIGLTARRRRSSVAA